MKDNARTLKLKLAGIAAKITKLKNEHTNLLSKLKNECSHDEVLITKYDRDAYWASALICTTCGLYYNDDMTFDEKITNDKNTQKLLAVSAHGASNKEFEWRKKEILKNIEC